MNKMNIEKDDVAIVGMSCRFPGANNIDQFWSNLCNGIESVSEFSINELRQENIDENLLKDPNYIRRAAIVENVDKFAAEFFEVSSREAELTDPQHRLLLELAWHALEDAAYPPSAYEGNIGAYFTCSTNQYYYKNVIPNLAVVDEATLYNAGMLNSQDVLATKIAYKLNLRGPAITISTACSSSLVAVHYACLDIINGACTVALAGGIGLSPYKKHGYLYRPGMIFSATGHCQAFDAQASGIVPGNGGGIVVLKKAINAINDGDNIYAIIKGSAVNNDGHEKIGFYAPSVQGQARAILAAYKKDAINPRSIKYVEAHGTGTLLGDPVEIQALTDAFRIFTPDKQFCGVGSVKTNFGHLDVAAGIAGLIKAALIVRYKKIPPSINFTKPNPYIPFADSPFYVNNKLSSFETSENNPSLVAVSSFGIGGTNAHAILQPSPPISMSEDNKDKKLILLSATSFMALKSQIEQLRSYIEANPQQSLNDIAYTLQVGRTHLPIRTGWLCADKKDLLKQMEIALTSPTLIDKPPETNKKISKELYKLFSNSRDELTKNIVDNLYKLMIQLNLEGVIPSQLKNTSEQYLFLLKYFWQLGYDWNWNLLKLIGKRISLPLYPFEKKSYWMYPPRAIKTNQPLVSDTKIEDVKQNLEEDLTSIWQEYLSIKNIKNNDNFFNLGGDSLTAMILIEKMNQRYGTKLNENSLIEYPTISQLADVIKKNIAYHTILPTAHDIILLNSVPYSKYSIFWVHPIGGTVYCYYPIAKKLVNVTSIGLQDPSFNEGKPVFSSIEQMAAAYVDKIQKLQPQGPYFILGHSFGGFVAYQISLDLIKKGQTIDLLVMLDTPGPQHLPKKEGTEVSVLYTLLQSIDRETNWNQFKDVTNPAILIDYAIKHKIIPAEFEKRIHEILAIFMHNRELMHAYRPVPNSTLRPLYLKAAVNSEYLSPDHEQSWLALFPRGMEVITVPGNHDTLLEDPNAAIIAEILNKQFDRFNQ